MPSADATVGCQVQIPTVWTKWQTISLTGLREVVVTEAQPEPGGGPTVRRMLVGARLRRLRTEAGISREQAGEAIRASEWKLHRLDALTKVRRFQPRAPCWSSWRHGGS